MINETAVAAIPAVSALAKTIAILQASIGGLFGLYFIYLLLRWRIDTKTVKILKDIRREVSEINKKVGKKK